MTLVLCQEECSSSSRLQTSSCRLLHPCPRLRPAPQPPAQIQGLRTHPLRCRDVQTKDIGKKNLFPLLTHKVYCVGELKRGEINRSPPILPSPTQVQFLPELRSRPIFGGSGSGSDPSKMKLRRLRLWLR